LFSYRFANLEVRCGAIGSICDSGRPSGAPSVSGRIARSFASVIVRNAKMQTWRQQPPPPPSSMLMFYSSKPGPGGGKCMRNIHIIHTHTHIYTWYINSTTWLCFIFRVYLRVFNAFSLLSWRSCLNRFCEVRWCHRSASTNLSWRIQTHSPKSKPRADHARFYRLRPR